MLFPSIIFQLLFILFCPQGKKEKKMKKTLCMLLAALMLLAVLTACGGEAEVVDTKAETEADTVAETEAQTEAAKVDPNQKDAGVLTFAQYIATEDGKEVVVEAFLQAKYDYAAAYGNTSLYFADGEGAYYVYRFTCTQEEYDKLTVGAKYKITGTKSSYAGEIEVSNVTALEAVGTDTYVAEVLDVTAKLEDEKLSADMNKFVAIKGAVVAASTLDGKEVAFLYKYNGAGAQGDDLYFNVKVGEKTYTYCVESDFCNKDTAVYKAVEALKVGDKINLEGFLYWYNAAQIQVTAITAAN